MDTSLIHLQPDLYNAFVCVNNSYNKYNMILYCIHNILKIVCPNMEPQHRNLTTFLTGVVLYALFYSYVGTLDTEHVFLSVFFNYSTYIVMADAFAMAILYKNHYHHSIFKEVEEMLGSTKPQATTSELVFNKRDNNVFDTDRETPNNDSENVLLLSNDSHNDSDSMEGFVKQSALDGVFTQSSENWK